MEAVYGPVTAFPRVLTATRHLVMVIMMVVVREMRTMRRMIMIITIR